MATVINFIIGWIIEKINFKVKKIIYLGAHYK